MILHTCQLNIKVAGLSKPWPNGVVQICNRAMLMSPPELAHFLNIHFMNLIQGLTCPLLWWWYANDTACSTLMLLQNFWNLSETKFVPASDISLHGMLYLANISFTVAIRFLLITPPISLPWGICCGNLQCINNSCY